MKLPLINIVGVYIVIIFGIIGVTYSAPDIVRVPLYKCPDGYIMCEEGCRTIGERCDGRTLFGFASRESTTSTTEEPHDGCGHGRFLCYRVCKDFGDTCDGRVVDDW